MKRLQLYRFLCNSLALDFHPDRKKSLVAELDSGRIPWKKFLMMASSHLVLQTIFRIYRDHDLLGHIPGEVSAELEKIYLLNYSRNEEMMHLCGEINSILKNGGIEPIFTKGIGSLLQNMYKDTGDRLMADADLLVHFDQLRPAVQLLSEKGYTHLKELDQEKIPDLKHFPRIFKPGSLISFELHWEPVKPGFRHLLNTDQVATNTIYSPNGLFRTMSWQHALQHTFIHVQLEHHAHFMAHTFLRYMYDVALISQHVDPDEALQTLPGRQNSFASYLHLTGKTLDIERLCTPAIMKDSSKLFLLRAKLNYKTRFFSFIYKVVRLIFGVYLPKIAKTIINKNARKEMIRKLSSSAWIRRHLNVYKKLFRGPGNK